MPFTLFVCGSKKFTDRKLLERSLNAVHRKRSIGTLITGSHSGAEEMAHWWAVQKPLATVVNIPHTGFSAVDYMHRYERIFSEYKIDGVVALGGAAGLNWLLRFAQEKGVAVWSIHEYSKP